MEATAEVAKISRPSTLLKRLSKTKTRMELKLLSIKREKERLLARKTLILKKMMIWWMICMEMMITKNNMNESYLYSDFIMIYVLLFIYIGLK